MKKISIISTFFVVLFFMPVVVFAQGKSNQAPNKIEIDSQDDQVQTITKPEGLENDEEENESSNGKAKGHPKSVNLRSETAREHMSIVAKTVEEILTTQGSKGGIGKQVSEVAKAQQQSQEETEEQLNELEKRPGWLKKLIGPNYKAIKNINRQIKRNQQRIEMLEQLKIQTTTQTDQDQISDAVQAVTNQNNTLQEYVNSEGQTVSLLGWVFKSFIK